MSTVIVQGPPAVVAKFDDDTENLIDLSILLDLPDIVSVARYVWREGVGYEVRWTIHSDVENFRTVMTLIGTVPHIHFETYGQTESGVDEYRSLFWEGAMPDQRFRLKQVF